MNRDEQAIRQLVADWMEATRAGDAAKVLALMADDVVFLRPGHPPMRKDEFERAIRAQAAGQAPQFDGKSEIQEVQLAGDWAFMWSKLTVTGKPPGGASPVTRTGHTLTVFTKQSGKWLLARDANMLA